VISELRQKYDLKLLLKISGVSRSTYYYVLQRMQAPDKHEALKAIIQEIFYDHKARYGYRRITLELRNSGHKVNHKTVLRLMNEMGLYCKIRRKKYNSYKGETGREVPDIIRRDFHADRPKQKWTTDVTEFALFGKKVYLSPVLDMYNSEIVSYTISMSPNYTMVESMVAKAVVSSGGAEGVVFHSDQGWQYRMAECQRTLRKYGIGRAKHVP